MKATSLIVDDLPESIREFARILEQEGYEVIIAENELWARHYLDEKHPALVILDIRFGDEERKGLDILKVVRKKDKTIPVMMLTSLDDERLDPLSYDLDADHFASKSMSTKALLARVKRFLRRDRPQIAMIDDHIEIDRGSRSVKKNSEDTWQEIHLQPKEFDVLEYLVTNAGRVILREVLYERFFSDAEDPSNALNRCIRELRRKLEPDPSNPRYILTRRGVGYQFEDYT
jgi:two-component system response regulator VicR